MQVVFNSQEEKEKFIASLRDMSKDGALKTLMTKTESGAVAMSKEEMAAMDLEGGEDVSSTDTPEEVDEFAGV